MNTMEDKVRLALRETGNEIGPHASRRCDCGAPGGPACPESPAGGVPGSPRWPPRRRWPQWSPARWPSLPRSTATPGSPAGPRRRGGTVPPPVPGRRSAEVPPYFVVLPPQAQIYARTALVRSTITGRVLATVSPPRPYKVFTWVNGTADNRTFVLAAQRWWNIGHGQAGVPAQNRDNSTPTVFFRLTFDPRTGTAQLSRLSVLGKVRTQDLLGMGVSPDGARLALDYYKSVQIVTLATSATRTWAWPGSGGIGNWKPIGQTFSWSADGRYLEFQQWGDRFNETMHVRMLDTTAPGTSLATAKVILAYPYRSGHGTLRDRQLVPHPGRHQDRHCDLLLPTARPAADTARSPSTPPAPASPSSTRTGSARPSAGRKSSGPARTAVPSSSVTPGARRTHTAYTRNTLGVLAGNKFTPIPHGAIEGIKIAW